MEDTREYRDQIARDPEDDHRAFLPQSQFSDTQKRRRELDEMREWERRRQAENTPTKPLV